jgi:ribosomal protein S18 acetylase RimI-like enzyme
MDNPPVYTVTKLNHHDLAIARLILAVQLAGYQVESALIDYPALPPLLENIVDIQTSGEQFLGCWSNDQLVGVLSFERIADVVDICRLVVAPEAARRGVGSQLLMAVEAREVDCRRIVVSTAERNIPAIKLYERNGYHLRKRRQLSDGLRLVEFEKER